MISACFSVLSCILILLYAARTQVEAYSDDVWKVMQDELYFWDQYDIKTSKSRSESALSCARPDFYTCELPPNVGLPESTRTCSYRSVNFQEQVYRWVSGHGCLFYTPGFLYVAGRNNISMTTGCRYGHLFAPCVEVAKEDGTCGCYPFDPNFQEVVDVVRYSLIQSARGRWERCVQAAVDCCMDVMIHDVDYPEGHCPSTFDAWTCWGSAPNGTMQSEICSQFAYSNTGPTCNHFSTKECFHNGTWNDDTDYTTCSISPRLERRYQFHIGVLAFSIAACLPAVFVFFFYRRLRITRVALHRNLLIAIIIRNIFVIISRNEVYLNELWNFGDTVMSTNSGWCRALAVAERIAGNAVFVCMLIEGIYLHRLIVAVFKKHHKMRILYGIGAVITIAPVLAWGIVMGLLDDHSCWVVYTVDHIQWILDGPRICILLINTILFSDILRVLITKVKNAENVNQLNTTKVSLFLMPVFGIQFLFTAFRPTTESCTWEEVYFFVAYSLEGLQGVIVALLYCYINKEVRNLVKATYKKTEAVVSRVRKDSNYRRSTLGQDSDRRITFSTALDPSDDPTKDTAPNLQVAKMISIDTNERLADILEPKYENVTTMGIADDGYESIEKLNENCVKQDESKKSNINYLRANDDVCAYCLDSFSSDSVSEGSFTFEDPVRNEIFDSDRLDKNDANYKVTNVPVENIKTNLDLKENKEEIPNFNPVEEETLDSELLNEIIEYVEKNRDNVILDSELLAPNRKKEDKIIFVDE